MPDDVEVRENMRAFLDTLLSGSLDGSVGQRTSDGKTQGMPESMLVRSQADSLSAGINVTGHIEAKVVKVSTFTLTLM